MLAWKAWLEWVSDTAGQEIQPGILKVAEVWNSQKIFSLSWAEKGKEKQYVVSVFCVNNDYYFKIVEIISGVSTSPLIGWMWLWVGVLAIHSKKGSGKSFPWDEFFWTWKWADLEVTFDHLDEWCQGCFEHIATLTMLLNSVFGPEKSLGMWGLVEENQGDILTQNVTFRTHLQRAH